jgi:hypothetical protein
VSGYRSREFSLIRVHASAFNPAAWFGRLLKVFIAKMEMDLGKFPVHPEIFLFYNPELSARKHSVNLVFDVLQATIT